MRLSQLRDDGRPIDAATLDAAVQQDERPTLPALQHRGRDAPDIQTPLLHLDASEEPCPGRARARLSDGMLGLRHGSHWLRLPRVLVPHRFAPVICFVRLESPQLKPF